MDRGGASSATLGKQNSGQTQSRIIKPNLTCCFRDAAGNFWKIDEIAWYK